MALTSNAEVIPKQMGWENERRAGKDFEAAVVAYWTVQFR
jgi:hypothetical protein